jgi:putative ubiquitin-RnfH superfamily antitoxin RatB of RatAB toxin-antitoxin module
MKKRINIEVAYALLDQQWLLAVEVEEGSTIEAAILQSGILQQAPAINLRRQTVGVFSKRKQLSDVVEDGDRIEIYRPLVIDPKEARRAKAKKARVKR